MQRPFIANPNLVERLREGKPLAENIDWMNCYGIHGPDGTVINPQAGYTDYPKA